jgi:hypothetical protein
MKWTRRRSSPEKACRHAHRAVWLQYHGLRHRSTGSTLWIEFHLLFAANTALASAHAVATRIEEELERQCLAAPKSLPFGNLEDHGQVHSHSHFERLPEG